MKMIPLLSIEDLPEEVVDYCIDMCLPVHDNQAFSVYNDGNIFAKWIEDQGYKFTKDWDWFVVIS